MTDVVADPEKLKQLARTLSSSADQLQQVARILTRALDLWNDAEGQRFEQELRQSMRNLNQFTDLLKSQYAPRVQKKAATLEQYRRH